MERSGIGSSIALGARWLAAGLLCTAAFAQEGDGAARAQRDASNPMRMIIEAGKLKTRIKPDEADAPAKPAAEAKPTPPKPAPAPTPQVATLAGVIVPVLVPVSGALPAAPDAVAFVPPPPPPIAADADVGAVPPLPEGAPKAARAAPAESAAPAPAASASAPQRAVLKLVDYVAPEIDERVRRRLRADGEVVLEFTVNPDGSVGNLAVRSASDRALEPAALDAVSKWRYEPIATAQAHGVQLVFKRAE